MKKSIILNIVIIFCEILGLCMGLNESWYLYYTNLSNIFALVATCLYVISLVMHKCEMIMIQFKYMATCMTTLTFLVVACVLVPMQGLQMFYLGNFIFFHVICPILLFVSFIFIDSKIIKVKIRWMTGILPTSIYACIILCLNILKIIEGPYPFLMVYQQPIYMSIIWIFVIIGIAMLVSKLLLKMNSL